MMNVTISMDEELHRETRIAAAKAGKSMSKYIADRLRNPPKSELTPDEIAHRKRQLELLRKVFEGPKLALSENGRMPDANERNARG